MGNELAYSERALDGEALKSVVPQIIHQFLKIVKDIAQGRYLNLEVIVPVFMKADINKNPVCASLMKTL